MLQMNSIHSQCAKHEMQHKHCHGKCNSTNEVKSNMNISFVLSKVVGKEVLFEGKSSAMTSKRVDSGDQGLERRGVDLQGHSDAQLTRVELVVLGCRCIGPAIYKQWVIIDDGPYHSPQAWPVLISVSPKPKLYIKRGKVELLVNIDGYVGKWALFVAKAHFVVWDWFCFELDPTVGAYFMR
ncbi:hypothetical protein PIB30_077783 [Stylosanthes scabra]|uniref:Uncharacterized protein n=1 Tax=Stylosanthes scabra TaxID=79078 RepID=A0ABU6RQH5_9FABA|nr:hypothetical protein [Stylosanthes scabra]